VATASGIWSPSARQVEAPKSRLVEVTVGDAAAVADTEGAQDHAAAADSTPADGERGEGRAKMGEGREKMGEGREKRGEGREKREGPRGERKDNLGCVLEDEVSAAGMSAPQTLSASVSRKTPRRRGGTAPNVTVSRTLRALDTPSTRRTSPRSAERDRGRRRGAGKQLPATLLTQMSGDFASAGAEADVRGGQVPIHTDTHTHSLSLSLSLTQDRSIYYTHHTHTHTHTHTQTHTHTHTHAHRSFGKGIGRR